MILNSPNKSMYVSSRSIYISSIEMCCVSTQIDYRFEEVQLLRLDVYDADSKNINRLSDHDYIGHCEVLHISTLSLSVTSFGYIICQCVFV